MSDTFQWTDDLRDEFNRHMKDVWYNFIKLHYLNGEAPDTLDHLYRFIESKAKQPLFTTEDGVSIYRNQPLWIVFKTYEMRYGIVSADGNHGVGEFLYKPENNKYFSTEAAAKEYILMNKPCLSYNDVEKICCFMYDRDQYEQLLNLNELKQLIQQKLSK